MARITMSIAENVADKIVEKIGNKIKDMEEQLRELNTEIICSKIPGEVLAVFEKYPKYIGSENSFRVSGHGFHNEWIATSKQLPILSDNYHNPIDLTQKEANKIKSIQKKIDDLREKKNKSRKDIYNTLLSLATYKRVQEQYPEAYPLLPPISNGTSLMKIPENINAITACLLSDDADCSDKI